MTQRDEQRSNRFRDQWAKALGRAKLSPDLDRLALVIALAGRADGTRAMASNAWLAERLGWSERTVKRRVVDLKEAGWIRRVSAGGRKGNGQTVANVYSLVVPAVSTGHNHADSGLLRPDENTAESAESVAVAALNGPDAESQRVNPDASTGQSPTGNGPHPREEHPRTSYPRNCWRSLDPERRDSWAERLANCGYGPDAAAAIWEHMREHKKVEHPDSYLDRIDQDGGAGVMNYLDHLDWDVAPANPQPGYPVDVDPWTDGIAYQQRQRTEAPW